MAGDIEAQLAKARRAAERFAAEVGPAGGGGGLRVTIFDDSAANGRGVDRIFEAFDATIDDIPLVLRDAVPSVREAHRAVFSTEGSAGRGAWPPLAPRTLAERRRLGYGPGPILVRTGALMRHVLAAEAKINRTGDGFELRIEPGVSVGGVPKYRALAKGSAATNLPGRPMVAVGPQAATRITSTIQRALRARAAANGLR